MGSVYYMQGFSFVRYANLPRKYLRNINAHTSGKKGQGTLDQYVLHQNCFRCDEWTDQGICSACRKNMGETILYLNQMSQEIDKKYWTCKDVCKLTFQF